MTLIIDYFLLTIDYLDCCFVSSTIRISILGPFDVAQDRFGIWWGKPPPYDICCKKENS